MSQLHPSPTSFAGRVRAWVRDRIWHNSSRTHLDAFVRDAAQSLPIGARVLDAGAGVAPYRHHFSHVSYETADFLQVEKGYAEMDYVCDLSSIPVPDKSFDAVLLTQVLEHVAEPDQVLRELHRILRPGGSLFLSAPLFYMEHEQPHDYYRFTQFGFRHLLSGANFRVESISWLEGYAGTVSYQFKEAVLKLPNRASDYGGGGLGVACAISVGLSRIPLFALSVLLAWADARHPYVRNGQCKNYKVHAVRPEPVSPRS